MAQGLEMAKQCQTQGDKSNTCELHKQKQHSLYIFVPIHAC